MTFDLVYTHQAKRDLNDAADFIAQHAPQSAERWFNGFVAALATLRNDALLYSLAPENEQASVEVRQLIYRTKSRRANRALYTIRGTTVHILAIRRPGQDLLTDAELQQAIHSPDWNS
jgi:plasmid stabilization system protein ParE